MASAGTGFDLSASTYSPDGRIFQVEYAATAVAQAPLTVGLRYATGIVLATLKRLPTPLLVPTSTANDRIQSATESIGILSAGLPHDARAIAERARDEAASLRDKAGEHVRLADLARRIAAFKHVYTLYSSVRPWGISTLLGGVDIEGPMLAMIEPSGEFLSYNAVALGKGNQLAKTEFEKIDFDTIDGQSAIEEVARIMLQSHEEKEKKFTIEMSWCGKETGNIHRAVAPQVVQEAMRIGQQKLDEADE